MQQISGSLSPRTGSLVPAFSLIELIIVILIASLFAAMVFTTVSLRKPGQKHVVLQRLKEVGQQRLPDNTELVCIDKCRQCFLMREGTRQAIKSQIPPLTAYTLDEGRNPQKIDFGRMDDRPICLRFYFHANGSTSQMILEADDTYYFVPSYFGEIQTFESLDEAASYWQRYRDQLDTMGTFY